MAKEEAAGRGAKDGGKDAKADDFVPPDFNEDEFIHREMVSFRTTAILLLWAIVAALAAWLVYTSMGGGGTGWLVALLVWGASALALRPIYRIFKADIRHFARREWTGTLFLSFFSWLAFLILLLNVPVSDHAPPRTAVFASPPIQEEGADVTVSVFLADNDEVGAWSLDGGGLLDAEDLGEPADGQRRGTAIAVPAGQYQVSVQAEDEAGRTHSASAGLTVKRGVLTAVVEDFTDPTGEVLVQTPDYERCSKRDVLRGRGPCILTVYAELDGGGRVVLEHSDAKAGWWAGPAFAGWQPGANNFTVHAELLDRFHGTTRIPGGTVEVPQGFGLDVTVPVGEYEARKVYDQPPPPVRSAPGAPVVLVGLALLGAAALVARKSGA